MKKKLRKEKKKKKKTKKEVIFSNELKGDKGGN